MKTPLTIGLSPISNRIYIGRGRPEANHWSGEKVDVTEQACHYVAEHVLNKFPGKSMILRAYDPDTKKIVQYEFEITKKEVDQSEVEKK